MGQYKAADEAAMVDFGRQLAGVIGTQGAVIFLEGDLGMGKTTLSRGVLQGYGHTGAVKSPTYTLVEPYELHEARVAHFDLYRLGDPEELEFLGIRDYFEPGILCLIEWAERGAGVLPKPDLVIEINVQGRGRQLEWHADTAHGQVLGALLDARMADEEE